MAVDALDGEHALGKCLSRRGKLLMSCYKDWEWEWESYFQKNPLRIGALVVDPQNELLDVFGVEDIGRFVSSRAISFFVLSQHKFKTRNRIRTEESISCSCGFHLAFFDLIRLFYVETGFFALGGYLGPALIHLFHEGKRNGVSLFCHLDAKRRMQNVFVLRSKPCSIQL
jgi:hypothetical protein